MIFAIFNVRFGHFYNFDHRELVNSVKPFIERAICFVLKIKYSTILTAVFNFRYKTNSRSGR